MDLWTGPSWCHRTGKLSSLDPSDVSTSTGTTWASEPGGSVHRAGPPPQPDQPIRTESAGSIFVWFPQNNRRSCCYGNGPNTSCQTESRALIGCCSRSCTDEDRSCSRTGIRTAAGRGFLTHSLRKLRGKPAPCVCVCFHHTAAGLPAGPEPDSGAAWFCSASRSKFTPAGTVACVCYCVSQ